jgi:hypothetical protein
MSDVVEIRNDHAGDSGALPAWAKDRPDDGYFAYFENEHGEQWFLLATHDLVRLAGGDRGWRTYELHSPRWKDIESHAWAEWADLILSPSEHAWVGVCLRTATE